MVLRSGVSPSYPIFIAYPLTEVRDYRFNRSAFARYTQTANILSMRCIKIRIHFHCIFYTLVESLSDWRVKDLGCNLRIRQTIVFFVPRKFSVIPRSLKIEPLVIVLALIFLLQRSVNISSKWIDLICAWCTPDELFVESKPLSKCIMHVITPLLPDRITSRCEA